MDERIGKSLKNSLLDGIFASAMMGLSETFITPYALRLGASASLIGVLASTPNLIASLTQVHSAVLSETMGSRKALINSSVLAQAFLWLPIMAIPYIFRSGQGIWLVISYTIFVSTGALSLPAWSSLMADHVPETERGRVFGWRNRLFGIINVSCMFAAGLVLQFFKNITGFTVIFAAAFLARLVSWRFLTRMYEPPLSVRDEDRFTIIDFFRRLRTTNFGRFVIFASAMSFSVNIAAPFFAVYMLRDLRFDYLTYTVIMMSATLTSLFMMNLWGVRADHVGNRRILRITSVFLPFIPVLWLFSHNVPYLILVQVFAGFFWAGFNLSASNFIYDAVTPQKRIRCIAYFNVINGTAIFAGAMTGGLLIRALPPLFGYRVLALLLVSGVLRLLASTLCSLVSEVRDVKKVSAMELFHSFVSRRPIFSFVSSGKE